MSVMIFLGLAALLAVCDWRHRAVPRIVCMGGAALGMMNVPVTRSFLWSLVGIVAGLTVGLLAGLPRGDVMVGGMLGAWLGVDGVLLVWMFALLVGTAVWAVWEHRMIDWPGDWPFVPLLLAPACAMVVGRGV